MKYRLDSPNTQATFSLGADGNLPFESKWSKPVSKLDVARTVFSTRSLGLTANWYKNLPNNPWLIQSTPSSTYLVYSGVMPIVKFWNPNSYPPIFGVSNDIQNWGLQLSGGFQAPYTGNYSFYFAGKGQIHSFKIGGSEKMPAGKASGLILDVSDLDDKSISVTGLTSGVWYPLSLFYYSQEAPGLPTGLVVRWYHSNHPEPVILSGGVTELVTDAAATDEMPIPYTTLSNITSVQLDRNKNAISKLTFRVPLVSTGSSYGKGYAYDTTNDRYYDIASTDNIIKQFWMVRYQEGYRYSTSTDELVTNFVGQIRDTKIKLAKNNAPELEVIAYDYSIFLKDAINKEAPNVLDYLSEGYRVEVSGHVNGSKKPSAYDGWEVHKAVKNLMVNSYIDPFLFTKKKIFTDYNGDSTAGSYNMYGVGITPPNYLPVQENYGNPDIVTGDAETADDEYLYGVNVGETYYDIVNKVLEPYAMNWGMTSSGHPFIESYNTPIEFIDDRDATFSGLSFESPVINCFKGTITTLVPAYDQTASAKATATGSKFDIITIDGGVGSFKAFVRKGVAVVSSATFNPPSTNVGYYYDGVDQSLGYNPCIVNIAKNLPYDEYVISFTSLATSNAYAYNILDSMFVYDRNIESPSMYLKSGDTGTPASIISLDVNRDSRYLRNESVVIGSRLGITVAENENHVFDSMNPNNPQFEHIVSRTLDINSVYKSTSENFVGRPLTTLIFDPSINDQDQADFLGFGLVNEFRKPNKEVTIEALNNPLIDVGDCISVKEEKRGIVTYNEKVWVEGISTKRDKDGTHTMSLTTTPIRPPTSWYSKPEPDLADFGNQPFQNVRLYNTGVITRLSSNLTAVATAEMVVTGDLASAPPSGYVRFYNGANVDKTILPFGKWNDDYNYEIIKYERRSTAGVTPGKLYKLTRGLQYTKPQATNAGDDDDYLVIGYDPYTQDGMGVYPVIKFDLVKSGKVECWVDAYDSRQTNGDYPDGITTHANAIPVDNLAWDGKEDIYNASKKLVWGKDRSFIWGGLDNIGKWNKYYSNDPNLKVYGGVFVAEQFKQNPQIIIDDVWGHHIYNNDSMYPYTKCRVRLILTADDGSRYTKTVGNIYIRRGHPGVVDFQIDYTNLLGYYNSNSHVNYPPNALNHTVSEGPVTGNTPAGGNDPLYNVIFNEETNDGKGLKFTIKESTGISAKTSRGFRNDSTADPHYIRYYSANIDAYIITGSWWLNAGDIQPVIEPISIYKRTEHADLYKDPVEKYFYPLRVSNDISFLPKEIRDKIIEKYREDNVDYLKYQAIIKKVIIFKGYFRDKSGRCAFTYPVDSRHYTLSPKIDGIPDTWTYGSYTSGLANNGFYDSATDQPNDTLVDEMSWRGNYVGWVDTVAKGLGRDTFIRTDYSGIKTQQNIDGKWWQFGVIYGKDTI